MRWFENTYGAHTLAAIIHDNLIVNVPNGGALASDTLSDPLLPPDDGAGRRAVAQAMDHLVSGRTAVALVAGRTETALGHRLDPALAVVGIASFVSAAGSVLLTGVAPPTSGSPPSLAILPPVDLRLLWGKQYGAGLVAAAAALWILPGGQRSRCSAISCSTAALSWVPGRFRPPLSGHPHHPP